MLQYCGFDVLPGGRQYSFRLSQKDANRDFTLLVPNASFRTGLLLYQEAPGVCYRKLSADLVHEDSTAPLCTHQEVTASEVTEYKASGKAAHKAATEEQRQRAKDLFKAAGKSHF